MSLRWKKEFESIISKLAGCPMAFIWDRILDTAGLVECFSVIREIPRCSDILVCRWRVV